MRRSSYSYRVWHDIDGWWGMVENDARTIRKADNRKVAIDAACNAYDRLRLLETTSTCDAQSRIEAFEADMDFTQDLLELGKITLAERDALDAMAHSYYLEPAYEPRHESEGDWSFKHGGTE